MFFHKNGKYQYIKKNCREENLKKKFLEKSKSMKNIKYLKNFTIQTENNYILTDNQRILLPFFHTKTRGKSYLNLKQSASGLEAIDDERN